MSAGIVRGLRAASAWVLVSGCAAAPPVRETATVSTGESIEFAFGALDGSAVTSENTRGRVTALLFVTTYDLPSQAAARRLSELYVKHKPRFNATAVVLEAAENAVLADVFRSSLELAYPVALADAVELRASPTFAKVSAVPTLVLLDRDGRSSLFRFGLFETRELSAWLRDAEGRAPEP